MSANDSNQPAGSVKSAKKNSIYLVGFMLAAIVAAFAVTWTLVRMFEHQQDARQPFLRLVELDETSTDPTLWGQNWPRQYEQYKSTAGDEFYGGSSAMPESKLDHQPWLKTLYAGYAFSIDYREARGHAYMLYDQVVTDRVNLRKQSGACLHCHTSPTVLYRKVGLEAMGEDASPEVLAEDFHMDAVIRGFQEVSTKNYHEILAMMSQVPDGTPLDGETAFPAPPIGGFDAENMPEGHFAMSEVHPVSCIDCHDPKTMALRVTRPGFMQGIADLASSEEPLPHMPSIEKWRRGDKSEPYDPNKLATRQEMRSFACGQCHVEYYCADKTTLTFPWGNGLKIEQIEQFWDEMDFPDGTDFYDYKHGETGALVYKAQHPEFELWNQGIHARSGVSCADCHMPYEREGAMKLSNHNVRSPMENINNACQTCHNVPEDELRYRVETIQSKTVAMTNRAGDAMTEMVEAIKEAKAAGATDDDLEEIFDLQKKAMWRLDYISSENSKGFHADQEAARILAESIDFSRQAQALALKLRVPTEVDTSSIEVTPLSGVTETR